MAILWVLILCVIIFMPTSHGYKHVEPFFDSKTQSVVCYKSDSSDSLLDANSVRNDAVPCLVSVQKLRAGRQEVAAIGQHYTEPPSWVNVTLATIGQKFMQKNLVGFLYSIGLASLLVGSSVDALRVIGSAGNITRPETAGRRYLGNLLHFWFWAHGDLDNSNNGANFNPNFERYHWNQSDFFDSLNLIRSVHEKVSHQTHQFKHLYTVPLVSKQKDKVEFNERLWEAFEKDVAGSKLKKFQNTPIFPPKNGGTEYYLNQFAMAIQFWAFVALPIMNPEKALLIGRPNEEELRGYMHFWGLIAHVMGIRPEYNVCLQPDVHTAKIYFRNLMEEYFVPGLFQMDDESKVVLEVSVKGITKIYPFVDPTFALKQLCEDLLLIETKNVQKVLSPQARAFNSFFKNYRYLTNYPSTNFGAKFLLRGMIQVSAIKHLGFDILKPHDFTSGILTYDESVLDTTNLWLWLNNTKSTSTKDSGSLKWNLKLN